MLVDLTRDEINILVGCVGSLFGKHNAAYTEYYNELYSKLWKYKKKIDREYKRSVRNNLPS